MIFALSIFAQSKGEITGVVIDQETGEPMPFANVSIDGTTIGTAANAAGIYYLSNIDPGTYTLKVSFLGYKDFFIEGVKVLADNSTLANVDMVVNSIVGPDVIVKAYKVPLIDPFETSTGDIFTTEDLETLPTNELEDAIALVPGVNPSPTGGFSFRGAREGSTAYFVDGQRVQIDPGLPTRAVYSLEAFTGGIPAKYGDATGGVVVIATGSFLNRR